MKTTVKGVFAQEWAVFYHNNDQVVADTTTKKILRVRRSAPFLTPDCDIEIDTEIFNKAIEIIDAIDATRTKRNAR